jgi:hypothetical protein
MMPRTRLASDSLSHLRVGWSVASGRLNLESDPRIGVATSGKSRAAPNLREQPRRFSTSRLTGCSSAGQPETKRFMGAIRLNRRAMEWGFPWTAAIHPMEIDLNGEATALCRACPQCGRCPGLRLQCEVRSCGWVAQRSRFTAPGGWQQHTPPIADYPLAGVTLQSGRLDQARLHSAALQPGPAECGRGRRPRAVLMASR